MNTDTTALFAATMFTLRYVAQAGSSISRTRKGMNAFAFACAVTVPIIAAQLLDWNAYTAAAGVAALIIVVGLGLLFARRSRSRSIAATDRTRASEDHPTG